MELGLSGRTALVSAASRGIGFGIAGALAGEGANVAISSRSPDRIKAAAGRIGARGYVHDTSDIDDAPRLVEAVESDLGPIDILVTNTGGPPGGADPLGFGRDEWRAAYRDLVLEPMALIERVAPGMRERRFGRIVSVSSIYAREPSSSLILSSAHRSGLLATFKALARVLAGDGVTLNTLLPGRIATERQIGIYGSMEEAERAAEAEVPAGRLGTIEEVGALAAFLCSDAAAYLTGIAIPVDGGLSHAP
ncbi:MAG TPA: SDR family oxidoreductase [Thermoleophilaceae bacterium]|nr:SDR family oxidoreductase [Thermoleophilaceae bacterium]